MGVNFDLVSAIENRRMATPQKSYLWRVGLPDLRMVPPSINNIKNSTDVSLLRKQLSTLPPCVSIEPRITAIQAPFTTFEIQTETFQNSSWSFVGKNNTGQISMTIQEYEDGQTYEYLHGWMRMIKKQDDGTYFPPAFYKRDIHVYRLDTTKQTITDDTYIGFFLSGINEISNEYDTSGIVGYNITMAGDSMTHKLVDRSYVGGLPIDEQQILKQRIINPVQFGGLGKDDWTRVAQSAFGDLMSTLG